MLKAIYVHPTTGEVAHVRVYSREEARVRCPNGWRLSEMVRWIVKKPKR